MKTIELQEKDSEFLKAIMETSMDGMSIGDVRRSIRVLDKLDEEKEILTIDDQDHSLIIARFEESKFVRAERFVLDLYDRLVSASDG